MSSPDPVVYEGSEVPEVEQRPMCPGLPLPVGDSIPPCGHFAAHHPHVIGESVRYRTAEEQSGGAAALRADVVALVLEEIKALRYEIDEEDEMRASMYARLDRIEAAVREGEQR